jgi:hypothetical protein
MDGREDFERGLPTLARRTSAPASVVVSQLGAAVRRAVPPRSRGSREMGGTTPRYLKGGVGREVSAETQGRVGLEPPHTPLAPRGLASASRHDHPNATHSARADASPQASLYFVTYLRGAASFRCRSCSRSSWDAGIEPPQFNPCFLRREAPSNGRAATSAEPGGGERA